MEIIKNLTEENLKAIASELNGNLWMKGDKIRIYVNGGNNYQYNGKWHYEITSGGNWEAKCYLTEGYNNKNREAYVAKYLKEMEEEMINVLKNDNKFDEEINQILNETVSQPAEEEIYEGEEANFGNNEYQYPVNFYNGCGSYYLAFKENKLVASVNYTSDMLRYNDKQKTHFQKQLSEKGVEYDNIISADGSGTTFFGRSESDCSFLETKIYYVPKAGGGKHKNIELILN